MVRLIDERAYGKFDKGYWYCGYCNAKHTTEVRKGFPGTMYPNIPSQCKICKTKTIKWLLWHKLHYRKKKLEKKSLKGLFMKR